MPHTTAFIAWANLQCPSLDGPFKIHKTQQQIHKRHKLNKKIQTEKCASNREANHLDRTYNLFKGGNDSCGLNLILFCNKSLIFCSNVKKKTLTNGQEELIDVHGCLSRGLHKEQASVFSICLGLLCKTTHRQVQIQHQQFSAANLLLNAILSGSSSLIKDYSISIWMQPNRFGKYLFKVRDMDITTIWLTDPCALFSNRLCKIVHASMSLNSTLTVSHRRTYK